VQTWENILDKRGPTFDAIIYGFLDEAKVHCFEQKQTRLTSPTDERGDSFIFLFVGNPVFQQFGSGLYDEAFWGEPHSQ